MGEIRNAHNIVIAEGKIQLWRPGRRWEVNITTNMDFMSWIYVDREKAMLPTRWTS
jgi:hypothetical protein